MVVRWPLCVGLIAALCLMTGSPSPAAAGSLDFETGGSSFSAPVRTLKEIRFQRVVKQEYDFSCGSAALATLLTYHYNRPTLEDTALKAMFKEGDQERIRKEGFSMLDMKHYLDS